MNLSQFKTRVAIEKGWSSDKKDCVTDENDVKFLLRISSAEQYNAKKFEFAMMEKLAQLNITMCIPFKPNILIKNGIEKRSKPQRYYQNRNCRQILNMSACRLFYDFKVIQS